MRDFGFYKHCGPPDAPRFMRHFQHFVCAFAELGESLVRILTLGFFGANWTLPLMGWFLDREKPRRKK